MNSSLHQSLARRAAASSETFSEEFAVSAQAAMPFGQRDGLPGSYDDASVIRGVLIQAIKLSGFSRITIADRMSYLLGRSVTEKMLNAFTAESRDDRRWPAEFDRAFCEATGDNTLLRCRAELAGLHVIDAQQLDLLELGRAFLQRTQAEDKIARLQARLSGRPA